MKLVMCFGISVQVDSTVDRQTHILSDLSPIDKRENSRKLKEGSVTEEKQYFEAKEPLKQNNVSMSFLWRSLGKLDVTRETIITPVIGGSNVHKRRVAK